MLPNVLLTSDELGQLQGLPYPAIVLYLWLRTRMNLRTGRVGDGHPQVSWQAIREDMYQEPHRGPGNAPSMDRFALWRVTQHLVRRGLVAMLSNADQRLLIFHLPRARLLSHVQNKPALIPHLNPHQRGHRANPQKPAPAIKAKPARHRSTALPTVAAFAAGDIATSGAGKNLTWLPTYPQAYSQDDRRSILQVAYEKHLDADAVQLALDELSGIEKRALVRNRAALFFTIAKQMNNGTFFGNQAAAERSYGTPLSPEELQLQNEGGMQL